MESNGKQIDKKGQTIDFKTGAIIWGGVGSDVQHSFFQLLHQGMEVVPIEFVAFKCSQNKGQTKDSHQKLLANLFAQAIALAVGKKDENPNKTFLGNRPSHILLSEKLDFETLGALLSYYEHKVAFQGFLWGINSFDQEGVQLGKVLANKMIDLFSEKQVSFPIGKAYLDNL